MPTHRKRALYLIIDGCEPPCGCWKLTTSGRAVSALNL